MNHTLSNAIWLAARQMRELWISYVVTVAYFAFMAVTLATGHSLANEFAHPVLMLILINATLASRYMTFKEDNDIVRHQAFLRGLPLPLRTTIVARLIAMLCAGVLNVPVYFGLLWFAGDWDLTIGQFIAWSLFWVGIALIFAGVSLIQEFWFSLRNWSIVNFAIALTIIAILPILVWVFDFRPIRYTMEIAAESPVPLAIVGLVLGIAGLMAEVNIAERVYRKREFVT